MINTGIIGFGLSGRVFHAPFLHVHEQFNLHSIVTTGNLARKLYPSARTLKNATALFDDPDIDLVVVCTPNAFHADLALEALNSGKHVVIEKPVTPLASQAEELFEMAERVGKYVFPYQNRRWDGDFMTIRHILRKGWLGDILDYEVHFDRFVPQVDPGAWRYTQKEAGGTLYDLGIHMADQAVVLFGKPRAVFCRLFRQRRHSVVDDSFDLKLIYPDLNVTIKSSVFVREPGPRFVIHGSEGSFVKYGLDPQEALLDAGHMPRGEDWGKEDPEQWGLIHARIDGNIVREKLETLPGNYMHFYDQVHEVIQHRAQPVITPEEVLTGLKIIERSMESAGKENVIKY